MNRKLITASVSAVVLAFGAASASADVIIGSTGQSNSQAANSSQSGENGGGGGSTFILGSSAPTTTQSSDNILTNDQEIGGGAGNTTLIAPSSNACFCQSSQQGVNSQQAGGNGDGGGSGTTAILGDSAPTLVQTSDNVLDNGQFIGGGAGPITTTVPNPDAVQCRDAANLPTACGGGAEVLCFDGPAIPANGIPCNVTVTTPGTSTILIGGSAQVNQQGVNSAQSGENGAAGGSGILVIGGDSLGLLDQESDNVLTNTIILGG
jgi:hypothetical protein